MTPSELARTRLRRTFRATAVSLVIFITAIIGTLAYQSASSQSGSPSVPPLDDDLRDDDGGTTSETDGTVPDGVTVFDNEYPGVSNLNPELLGALREAAMDAADEGIAFYINSGWRSPEYQDQLFREAVLEYGSEEEAARWVATADVSAHVSRDAVDIGHSDATAWLSEHGDEYGLCQIYSNEPWHYELRPNAMERGCPPMYADPTRDPRMQQ